TCAWPTRAAPNWPTSRKPWPLTPRKRTRPALARRGSAGWPRVFRSQARTDLSIPSRRHPPGGGVLSLRRGGLLRRTSRSLGFGFPEELTEVPLAGLALGDADAHLGGLLGEQVLAVPRRPLPRLHRHLDRLLEPLVGGDVLGQELGLVAGVPGPVCVVLAV